MTNTAPKPRNVRHESAPALHLAKTAWRKGYRGLACIFRLCWDAGFQPGDAHTKHLGDDPQNGRLVIDRSTDGRSETEVAVIGTLSRLGDAMMRTYLKTLGIERIGEALLFRTRPKQPYRDTVLSHDFADVRAMADPGDPRRLQDMCRSATTEAFRGGADPKAVSQKFGNSIDRSTFLSKTYDPVDLEQVRQADQARVRDRRKGNSAGTLFRIQQPTFPNGPPRIALGVVKAGAGEGNWLKTRAGSYQDSYQFSDQKIELRTTPASPNRSGRERQTWVGSGPAAFDRSNLSTGLYEPPRLVREIAQVKGVTFTTNSDRR